MVSWLDFCSSRYLSWLDFCINPQLLCWMLKVCVLYISIWLVELFLEKDGCPAELPHFLMLSPPIKWLRFRSNKLQDFKVHGMWAQFSLRSSFASSGSPPGVLRESSASLRLSSAPLLISPFSPLVSPHLSSFPLFLILFLLFLCAMSVADCGRLRPALDLAFGPASCGPPDMQMSTCHGGSKQF